MKSYYEESGITIYHADCREVLPSLEPVDLFALTRLMASVRDGKKEHW